MHFHELCQSTTQYNNSRYFIFHEEEMRVHTGRCGQEDVSVTLHEKTKYIHVLKSNTR